MDSVIAFCDRCRFVFPALAAAIPASDGGGLGMGLAGQNSYISSMTINVSGGTASVDLGPGSSAGPCPNCGFQKGTVPAGKYTLFLQQGIEAVQSLTVAETTKVRALLDAVQDGSISQDAAIGEMPSAIQKWVASPGQFVGWVAIALALLTLCYTVWHDRENDRQKEIDLRVQKNQLGIDAQLLNEMNDLVEQSRITNSEIENLKGSGKDDASDG